MTRRHRAVTVAVALALLGGCSSSRTLLRPGAHVTSGKQDDRAMSASAPSSTLFCRLRDMQGAAVPLVLFQLPELRLGAITDEDGTLEIPRIAPGPWLVRWHVSGIPHGDSLRVRFEAGGVETLDVRVEIPKDRWEIGKEGKER